MGNFPHRAIEDPGRSRRCSAGLATRHRTRMRKWNPRDFSRERGFRHGKVHRRYRRPGKHRPSLLMYFLIWRSCGSAWRWWKLFRWIGNGCRLFRWPPGRCFAGRQLKVLKLSSQNVVTAHQIEIALQTQYPEHSGINCEANAGISFLRPIQSGARNSCPFCDRFSGVTAAKAGHA
jgi:hypothetical protein